MKPLLVAVSLALAACGADGKPEPPARSGADPSHVAEAGMVTR